MYREENRAFSFAVLASIVLHAMLLFGVTQPTRPRSPPESPAPLIARIAEPPAPAPAPPPAVIPPEVKPPPERPKLKPRATPVEKPKPPVLAKPAAVPVPSKPEVAEPAEAPPPPASVARTEPAPPAPPPASPAVVQPQPVETAPDPRTIAEYRMQIIGAAPRYKRYPPVARENNWEGLVRLRMQFSGTGRLAEVSVTRTSGYDVLDKQAEEMFRNAAESVPVPPVLRGKAFSVDVAAVYGLTD